MGVQYQGALKLDAVHVDGHPLGGLSALAHDADQGVLYALSDGGVVFEMVLDHDESGFLQGVGILRAFALKNAGGEPLKRQARRQRGTRPAQCRQRHCAAIRNWWSPSSDCRACCDSPPGARLLGGVALPSRLRNTRLYKTSNRGLESLAWHPRHGYLTAVEQPFRDTTDGTVELHALDSGRFWHYPLAAEPNAGLAEVLVLRDGSLLTLERGFGVFFVPIISSLRRVRELPDTDGAILSVETVARFNTGQGWSLDNFEGLALLDGDRVVMVSDDNRRALQSTLLAQFRLLPDSPASDVAGDSTRAPAPVD